TGGGRDDHLAGLRILESGPGALEAARIPEHGLITNRSLDAEAQLLAFAPGHGLVAFKEEHRLRGLFGIQSQGKLTRSELALGQAVDHPGPIRGGDERSVDPVEAR